MPTTQVTLSASTVALVPLDAPTGRIIITQQAGTAAEVYATVDGSLPAIPSSGVELTNNQQCLPAVLGSQVVMQPPLYGDHMAIATVRLQSAGTPTVSVQW